MSAADFQGFIESLGFTPPRHIEPGRWTPFPTRDKRGDSAGRAKLFPDLEGGLVKDWRTDELHVWQAKRERPRNETEQRAWRDRIERERKEAQALRDREEKEAAQRARDIWAKAQPAPEDHPYLVAKGVKAHGLRIYRGPLAINGVRCDGALVVPVRNSSGELQTVECITPSGEKRFLPGGRKAGGYYSIGKPEGVLCIAEGFATAATVHEASGHPVAVAFDAGNLLPVVEALRAKFPDVRLILCADDDLTEGNPGRSKAIEAAKAVNGLVAIPDFGEKRPEGATDFNDLAKVLGLHAVRAAVDGAGNPEVTKPALRERKDGQAIYCKLADIEAKPIRWLWSGRIARGKVSIIAGHPGLGKSQITASMAAIVTTGGRWPVDRTQCEKGGVLFLSAEDDAADTIRPRLEAAGADLQRVHILQAIRDGFNSDGEERQRAFNLKEDVRRLEAVLTEIGDVALVVIDPISAYLGGADSHNNAEVRALLAPLSDMASRAGVAIVAVSHLNKGGAGAEALLRITGSLGFAAAARAAYIVAKDPEDERRRYLVPGKNNVGPDVGALAFAIEAATIDGGIATSRIAWEAQAVGGISADELLRTPTDPQDRTELEEAADWLRVALSDGPVEARELFRLGERQGFHQRALQRARQRVGANTKRDGFGKGSRVLWLISPTTIDDKNTIDDTDKTVSPMGQSVTYGGNGSDQERF